MCMRPVNNDKLQNELQLVSIMIVDGMACMASVIYNYLQHRVLMGLYNYVYACAMITMKQTKLI